MFIIPTKKRIRHQTASNAPTVLRGGKSRQEIASHGERIGYVDRELSAADVANLSADEYLWFETLFPKRLEEAAQREKNKRDTKQAEEESKVKQFWKRHWNRTDQPADETEAAKHRTIADRFTHDFPQLITSRKENACVVEYLKENNLAFTYQNLVHAFEACVLSGTAWVNPSAIGAGPETEVTGEALIQHRNVRLLMSAQSRPDGVSASEYYKQHKELHHGVPFLIRAREQQKEATQASFAKAASAVEGQGEAVRLIDYGYEQHGVPPLSEIEKASLRQKVKSMSAAELAQKCSDDPSFKKALDSLDK